MTGAELTKFLPLTAHHVQEPEVLDLGAGAWIIASPLLLIYLPHFLPV